MQFQTLRAVISLEIFRVEVGKEDIQLKGFMVICVRAVENVELGSYLYFNPTDTFFLVTTFNSLLEQGRQYPVLEGPTPARFSVLPDGTQVPQRKVGAQVKELSSAGIRPLRTGLGRPCFKASVLCVRSRVCALLLQMAENRRSARPFQSAANLQP